MLSSADRARIYGASRVTLGQEKDGDPGRRYLTVARGLDIETIARFRLGYVPFSANHEFSGRVVMPIFDMYDRLVALSVRHIYKELRLKDGRRRVAVDLLERADRYVFRNERDEKCELPLAEVFAVGSPEPKYWNEPFPKGEHLYGMNVAKRAVAKTGFAIMCEGQFDVMSMHSHGICNTVAVCGGAFTPIHAMLLKRWVDQIVILMDGDSAGRKHAARAKELLDSYQLRNLGAGRPGGIFKIAAVSLPEGLDPDSFLRRNGSWLMRKSVADAMCSAGMTPPKGWFS